MQRIAQQPALLIVAVAALLAACDRVSGEAMPSAAPSTQPVKFAVGVNLAPVEYWSRAWVFADVFKMNSGWAAQSAEFGKPFDKTLAIDKSGYPILKPGQVAATLMLRELDGHATKGIYTCTFDGKGEIVFRFDARAIRRAGNRIDVLVTPTDAGVQLAITRSDPLDPIRNIKLLMPGCSDAKSVFHPTFIERLRPFGVVRFMDWGRTNSTTVRAWSDRPTTGDVTQTGPGGVAAEYMIDLCNETNADAWLCVPHLASDDYVRHLAELVAARLHGERKVYVELSNEMWNTMFPQTRWLREEAAKRGVPPESQYASRSAEVFEIFEKVMGRENRGRIVRVLASQAANPGLSEAILAAAKPGSYDALAIAPYFGHDTAAKYIDRLDTITVDQALDLLDTAVDEHSLVWIAAQKRVAARYGTRLIAYEGGPHLALGGGHENNPKAVALLEAVNRHPRMEQTYGRMLRGWGAQSGDLFVAFNFVDRYTKWGCWGHLESMDEQLADAPKMRALLDFAAPR